MPDPRPLPEIVAHVLGAAPYWAPELRVSKLLPYLEHYGLPLYEALRALPDEDRAALGIDLVTPVLAAPATTRSDVAPPSPRSSRPT